MRDGVRSSEDRDRRKRKRMEVHGRSLEAVLNAIRNKAANSGKRRHHLPRKPRDHTR